MLPVAKASHSGTANPCSWLLLMLLGRLGVPQWGVATEAKGSRHVAALVDCSVKADAYTSDFCSFIFESCSGLC